MRKHLKLLLKLLQLSQQHRRIFSVKLTNSAQTTIKWVSQGAVK